MPEDSIVRADPDAGRKRLILAVLVVGLAALMLALSLWGQSYLARQLARISGADPERALAAVTRAWRLLNLLIGVGVAIPTAAGLYLGYVAVRTRDAGCFPYPGMWVLRDRRLLRGSRARRRAAGAALLGALLLFGGLGGGWYVWTQVGHVFAGAQARLLLLRKYDGGGKS